MPEKFVTKSRKILIYFKVKNYPKKNDFPTLLHIYSRKIVVEGKSRALDQYQCERNGNRKKFFPTFLFPSFQFFMICYFFFLAKSCIFSKNVLYRVILWGLLYFRQGLSMISQTTRLGGLPFLPFSIHLFSKDTSRILNNVGKIEENWGYKTVFSVNSGKKARQNYNEADNDKFQII